MLEILVLVVLIWGIVSILDLMGAVWSLGQKRHNPRARDEEHYV
jgi:hypothetical protein